MLPTDCSHSHLCTISFLNGSDGEAQILCNECNTSRISRLSKVEDIQEITETESRGLHQCYLCGTGRGLLSSVSQIVVCGSCLRQQREQVDKLENIMVTQTMIEDGYAEIPDCILTNQLYLGSQFSACDLNCLQRLNITAVLVCGKNLRSFFAHQPSTGIHYHNLPIEDSIQQPLLPFIHSAIRFLEYFILEKGQCVLVHCAAGISRSASVVIAFVMKHKQWSFQQAHDYVKDARNLASPNIRFRQELRMWEEICLSK